MAIRVTTTERTAAAAIAVTQWEFDEFDVTQFDDDTVNNYFVITINNV